MTSVTTHYKKLTTGNNVFSVLHQMFNVSALLLDDALKPATPLTNETLQQFSPLSDILQGSVATHLKYGWIFSDSVIANFLLILTINNFENRSIFDKVKAYKKFVPFFGPPCISYPLDQSLILASTVGSLMLRYCYVTAQKKQLMNG